MTSLFRRMFSKKPDTAISSDGVRYSLDQYKMGQAFVENYLAQKGYSQIKISRWEVTGAIAGFAVQDNMLYPVEFYMRDLVRGIIRQGAVAVEEYLEQVRTAGLVLE